MSAEPVYYYEVLSKADFLSMDDTIYILRFSAPRILFLYEKGYIRGSKISASTVQPRRTMPYYHFLKRDVSKVNDIMGGLRIHYHASQTQRWNRLMEVLGEDPEATADLPARLPHIRAERTPQEAFKSSVGCKVRGIEIGKPVEGLTINQARVALRLQDRNIKELITLGHLKGTRHPSPIGWRVDPESVARIKEVLTRRRLVRTPWSRVPEGTLTKVSFSELLKAIEEAE